MPTVRPFQSNRPAAEVVSRVAALPYDVYNRKEACEVVKKEPMSFLAIDRAETQFPDNVSTYAPEVYDKARQMLDDAIAQSVNNMLLMKMLPRMEGDAEMFALSREYRNKVGVPYDNRLEWLKDLAPDIKEPSQETTSDNGDAEESADKDKEHQQTAKEKIDEMIDRLNNQEFTRFWP